MIQNRLRNPIAGTVLTGSHYGFRQNQSTTGVIFAIILSLTLSFADDVSSFGLTINCKKVEVIALQNSAVRNPWLANGIPLANVLPSNTSAAPSQMTVY